MQNIIITVIVLCLLAVPYMTGTEGGFDLTPATQVVDFDGDGRADSVSFITNHSEGENATVWGELAVSLSGGGIYAKRFDDTPCHAEKFETADLDGDGTPEIIAMVDTLGNGGAGSHAVYVLKYADGAFTSVDDMLDLTYEMAFLDNYQFAVACPATSYATGPMDLPNLTDNHKDAWERIDEEFAMDHHVDSVYDFSVVPSDGGTALLELRQYAWGIAHADYIGDAVVWLQLKDGKWNVVKQWFDTSVAVR